MLPGAVTDFLTAAMNYPCAWQDGRRVQGGNRSPRGDSSGSRRRIGRV